MLTRWKSSPSTGPTPGRNSTVGGITLLADALGLDPLDQGPELRAGLRAHQGSLRRWVVALMAGHAQLRGVGPARLQRLDAALSLATTLAREQLVQGAALRSPQDCREWLLQHLAGRDREVFSCVFLNSRYHVIDTRDLFLGTLDSAAVWPRDIVKEALGLGASALIVAHNHPSGAPSPSDADLRMTQRLKKALNLVDIRLLDHFIVGRGDVHSMASSGAASFDR